MQAGFDVGSRHSSPSSGRCSHDLFPSASPTNAVAIGRDRQQRLARRGEMYTASDPEHHADGSHSMLNWGWMSIEQLLRKLTPLYLFFFFFPI